MCVAEVEARRAGRAAGPIIIPAEARRSVRVARAEISRLGFIVPSGVLRDLFLLFCEVLLLSRGPIAYVTLMGWLDHLFGGSFLGRFFMVARN